MVTFGSGLINVTRDDSNVQNTLNRTFAPITTNTTSNVLTSTFSPVTSIEKSNSFIFNSPNAGITSKKETVQSPAFNVSAETSPEVSPKFQQKSAQGLSDVDSDPTSLIVMGLLAGAGLFVANKMGLFKKKKGK